MRFCHYCIVHCKYQFWRVLLASASHERGWMRKVVWTSKSPSSSRSLKYFKNHQHWEGPLTFMTPSLGYVQHVGWSCLWAPKVQALLALDQVIQRRTTNNITWNISETIRYSQAEESIRHFRKSTKKANPSHRVYQCSTSWFTRTQVKTKKRQVSTSNGLSPKGILRSYEALDQSIVYYDGFKRPLGIISVLAHGTWHLPSTMALKEIPIYMYHVRKIQQQTTPCVRHSHNYCSKMHQNMTWSW